MEQQAANFFDREGEGQERRRGSADGVQFGELVARGQQRVLDSSLEEAKWTRMSIWEEGGHRVEDIS